MNTHKTLQHKSISNFHAIVRVKKVVYHDAIMTTIRYFVWL